VPTDTHGMRAALRRRRRLRHLSMLSYVVVLVLVALASAALPYWPALAAIALGALLLRGSDRIHDSRQRAAVAAYERARDGA